MDENKDREMKDQHSRDEAELHRSQQLAAGSGHGPVESYPQHGAEPQQAPPGGGAGAELYERALSREQAAWQRLKSPPPGAERRVLWHEWRSAVEERDRATRVLINQLLEEGGSGAASAGG